MVFFMGNYGSIAMMDDCEIPPGVSMRRIAGMILAASALLWSAGAAAQTYKCANAAGKVTYSSTQCSDLGLKDAGEVRNQLNVSPAQKVAPIRPAPAPQPAQAPKPAPAAAAPKVPDDLPPGTIIDQGRDDGKRCFTVKTAKGTSTRCNDSPD
jgi:hypothetical protein